jgi:hypothetical protein
MKNLKLLLLLVVIATGACKKKEATIDPKVAVIGKWQLKSLLETNYKNGVKQNENSTFNEEIIMEFKTNKDVVFDGTEYTYQIEGNNRLKLNYTGETTPEYDFEIKIISNTELNLVLDRSRTEKNGDVMRTTYELFFTK